MNQTMNLIAYLERIGYTGDLTPNLQTLTRLHRAHLMSIPYENLNIHWGRTLTLDENDFFEKLVTQRRGGWCYEMNGLFAWALREIGFEVSLLASEVGRTGQSPDIQRDHLILLVQLERPYLADVGFGNGIIEPLPLEVGEYQQNYFHYRLAFDGTYWHFTNQQHGGPGFDFTLQPYTLPDFAQRCHELQTHPESGFVKTTVCYRFTQEGYVSLRGAVLRTITIADVDERTLDTEAAYRQALIDHFDLQLADADISRLWERVWARHQVFLAEQGANN
jgi:N-hydroxyarylamine O-acetyltransferase